MQSAGQDIDVLIRTRDSEDLHQHTRGRTKPHNLRHAFTLFPPVAKPLYKWRWPTGGRCAWSGEARAPAFR